MNNKIVTVAAILTCHNRKGKTIICLTDLINQDEIGDVDLNVYLVDDGSTDGTSDAVKQNFPQVNVLQGDGTLYWNGGMRLAFSEVLKNDYDYYLWLNDDTFLYSDALKLLLETSKNMKQKIGGDVIVTGTIKDIETGEVNYGGRNQKSKLQPLKFTLLDSKTEPQQCDTFNGNVVLIPQYLAKEIGNISPEFSKQHGGDFDYGLRAKYAGFESWVAPGIIGTCSSNPLEGTIFDTRLSLKERRKKMNTPHGVPPAKEWMIFAKRHAGIIWPIYWLRTIMRVLFPWTYLYLRKP
ncbi:glycosyltransferase family 2 protein [bacterium]|nr:glycosyltransferase family 2 protein [bacterium]